LHAPKNGVFALLFNTDSDDIYEDYSSILQKLVQPEVTKIPVIAEYDRRRFLERGDVMYQSTRSTTARNMSQENNPEISNIFFKLNRNYS